MAIFTARFLRRERSGRDEAELRVDLASATKPLLALKLPVDA
jgi:hypothetical protein